MSLFPNSEIKILLFLGNSVDNSADSVRELICELQNKLRGNIAKFFPRIPPENTSLHRDVINSNVLKRVYFIDILSRGHISEELLYDIVLPSTDLLMNE